MCVKKTEGGKKRYTALKTATQYVKNSHIMKKLILLSLSVVAALGISMTASVKNNAGNADSDVRTEHRHMKKVAAHDPFAGIDLTETQKARLNEV